MNTVSIIVPSYNGADRIERTIDSLIQMNPLEIIVVVDGSTDGTLDVLNAYGDKIIVVKRENGGRARTRNTGAERAKGDILWFVDDDMEIEADIQDCYQHFNKYPKSIVNGFSIENEKDCNSDFQLYKRHLSIKWQKMKGKGIVELKRPYLTASNLLMPKNVFVSLKGFSEDLTDAEDFDLAIRALHHGYSLFYNPEILGWHLPPANVKEYAQRLKEYQLANRKVRSRHQLDDGLRQRRMSWVHKRFIASKFLDKIDSGSYKWLPKKLRYKLYDIILTAQLES